MKITITKNEQEFDQTAAWRIISQMLCKPNAVIGLSTGQTTINMHAIVSSIYSQYPFDISGVTLFNVDELMNVSRESSVSCYGRILEQIVRPLKLPEENFIMPAVSSKDFNKECELFQHLLEERGGIDLQILGIGTNGHIGLNQPGTPFESETWITPLESELEAKVTKETGLTDKTKLLGLTLGIKTIMRSRKIILAAKGSHKAEIIEKAFFGPVTIGVPASVLQLHPDCEVLLDAEAGERIKRKI